MLDILVYLNICLLFFNARRTKKPRTPQLMTSPIPTVNIINGIGRVSPYPNLNTNGTITALLRIGGRNASSPFWRKMRVPIAPNKVAILPRIMSMRQQPVRMLLSRHPINRPGTAAGVNAGSMVIDSDNRTWMLPLANPKAFDT